MKIFFLTLLITLFINTADAADKKADSKSSETATMFVCAVDVYSSWQPNPPTPTNTETSQKMKKSAEASSEAIKPIEEFFQNFRVNFVMKEL